MVGLRLHPGQAASLGSLRNPSSPRKGRALLFMLLAPAILAAFGCSGAAIEQPIRPPNIILIITDDQGWAQLGVRGNTVLQTPHLDRLASKSVEIPRFYTAPVCAPTRAGLLTGRYHYRTGVVDTYLGRAMMYPDELTLAEMLSEAGYRTAIFGKWHLGDHYPLRAIDQGFQHAVVHKGGGIGQPADPPGNSYFDPILHVNGSPQQFSGYCTDIFFDAALQYLEQNRDQPFFVYLATNAPHSPYDVPDEYAEAYRRRGLEDRDARIYGMITNIDDNVGRLMEQLESLGLEEDTILIFMTDNGPTTQHYTAGLRGQKASVYEGGIRVPFFVRWPAQLSPGRVEQTAAYIDLVPTLLEAAGTAPPGDLLLDGRSLLPLLRGEPVEWPDRVLYIQTHRGDVPQLNRNFAAIGPRYKLVQPFTFGRPAEPVFELYDLMEDPGEQTNLAERHPDLVRELRGGYEAWFEEVSSTRGYDPPRIHVGTDHENPVVLTRQDWRVVGPDGWGDGDLGAWEILVAGEGEYQVSFRFAPFTSPGAAELRIQGRSAKREVDSGAEEIRFPPTALARGEARLEALLNRAGESDPTGPRYVEVRRLR